MVGFELYKKLKFKSEKTYFLSEKKANFENSELQIELADLKILPEVMNFHPKRREEFLLGRILLKKAFKNYFNLNVTDFPIDKSRMPIAPSGFVISISHDADEVMVAISKINTSIGIDLENIGRIKPALEPQILSTDDDVDFLIKESSLNRDEVLTLVFSAKETLFKALYPLVKQYFGFEKASLLSIDKNLGTYKIKINSDLGTGNSFYGNGHSFVGHFAFEGNKLLTFMEL